MTKLSLPLPPSANAYWRAVVRGDYASNVLSTDAREYKKRVAELLEPMELVSISGEVLVTAVFFFPTHAGDLDNRIKPLLDTLQGHCFGDDRQITRIDVRREIDRTNPRVEVQVEGMTADLFAGV